MSCTETIDDIEDLYTSFNVEAPNQRTKKDVVYHSKRKKESKPKKTQEENEIEMRTPPVLQSVVPGTQRIYVKTWGCTHNTSDSEYMAGQLAAYGYNITDDKDSADLWLLNSCTVKTPAEDHFKNEIIAARKGGKHLVVSGCVPQGGVKEKFLHGLSIIGVQQIDRVIEVVEETLKGNTVRLLGQKKQCGKKLGGAPLALPKIRRNPLVEIISINTGCLNQCTYCKTKHARGELGSYPIDEIVSRVIQSFSEGVCEVWMTSEDTGAYGRDIGVTLPDLLWKVVEVIPEGCMLRLGMTNPPYILEHLEEIAKILSHPRVYSFLHIPVQSGSDAVLSDMKREYCIQDFKHVVNFLKQRVPHVTICTDIICGFPTEMDDDFDLTMQLCREYKFPSLFINQFYPRPGTPAARMNRLNTQVVKKRSKELSDFFQSYETHSEKRGHIYQVLSTEESHDKQFYVAHNKSYEQVLIPKEEGLLGKLVTVRITTTGKHFMKGEILKDSPIVELSAPLPKGQISGVQYVKGEVKEDKHYLIACSLLAVFVVFLSRLFYIVWLN